jgi:hypothetical protein
LLAELAKRRPNAGASSVSESASQLGRAGSAGFEEGGDQGDGEAYYVEVVAYDAGDPAGGAALDGVGAGFVHGLAGGDVGGYFFVGQSQEGDGGDFGGYFSVGGGDHGDAGDDAVGAAGKKTEHAGGVGCVLRLAENLAVEGYGGVGAEDGQGFVI